ncbi:MAG: hypothetical protein HQL87_11725 [Magnetococcales bacterium]|nr:hypothetical protein [Magnetococcales bacterium]
MFRAQKLAVCVGLFIFLVRIGSAWSAWGCGLEGHVFTVGVSNEQYVVSTSHSNAKTSPGSDNRYKLGLDSSACGQEVSIYLASGSRNAVNVGKIRIPTSGYTTFDITANVTDLHGTFLDR